MTRSGMGMGKGQAPFFRGAPKAVEIPVHGKGQFIAKMRGANGSTPLKPQRKPGGVGFGVGSGVGKKLGP